MGVVRNFFDGLSNALTGAGTRGDPRQANLYSFTPLSQVDIENAYRGSGLMRKIIDIPAEDTVREWREWKGDARDLSALWAEEKRLGIPQKVKRAEILRGLGGGALILGLPGDPALPANVGAMGLGKLEYIHVVSRYHLTAEGQWVDNPTDPLFGGPRMWMLNTGSGQVRVHPSRVICFTADDVPGLINGSAEDVFWGESRVQRVLSAVQDCDTARSSFAALIHKAQRTRVGIPNLSEQIASGGEADVQKRIATFALGESMFNATIYDAGAGKDSGNPGEQIDDVQYTFTGMKDVMEAFGLWAAAISDIPATRLLGRAAEGMNASGESQQKDWNKQIRARQTLVTGPCLDKLDQFLIPSALGKANPSVWYEFPPLDLPDEKTVAETFKTTMEAAEKLQLTGAIPDVAFNKGLQSTITEAGWMPALEGALEEIPEDERFGGEPEPIEPDVETLPLAANDSFANVFIDATPRPLYVRRDLKPASAKALIAWAKSNGFTTTLEASDMHVTILYSRNPVDPMKMGETWGNEDDGGLTIKPGGPRALEKFGEGAVVLQFASWSLTSRHADMVRAGASHDYEEYLPHVTITYSAPEGLDLDAIKPFTGELAFGAEIFEPLDLDWKSKIGEA